jgi:hypothetical protein
MRQAAWIGVVALVVLAARTIAYALAPSPLADGLAHRAGGPALPLVAAVSLGLGVVVSSAVVWLAALGVRERRLLDARPLVTEPRLRLRAFALRATALAVTSTAGFTLLESYVHWRAGLGWHGIHCLTGPVHVDALPILGALSLVAAAAATALEHVLAWMRRTLAALASSVRIPTTRPPCTLGSDVAPRALFSGSAVARGPPVAS